MGPDRLQGTAGKLNAPPAPVTVLSGVGRSPGAVAESVTVMPERSVSGTKPAMPLAESTTEPVSGTVATCRTMETPVLVCPAASCTGAEDPLANERRLQETA